jgi:hypothetical protein
MVVVLAAVWASSATPTQSQVRAADRLFSSYAPLSITLEAPFDDLLRQVRQKVPHPVMATLSYRDPEAGDVRLANVELSVRGHTSLEAGQCEFPKLKLKFNSTSGAPPGSLFDGMTTVKIGTHCGEGSDDVLSARWGRLLNAHSPLREAFIYRLLDALRVPTLKARPVRISYVYVNASSASKAVAGSPARPPFTLVRDAMFLEDTQRTEARLSSLGEYTEENFGSADTKFTPADAARLAFAQALVGNFDWCVRFFPSDSYRCNGRHGLFNVLALKQSDGSALPLPYDFDLAGMVTGHHRWFAMAFNTSFAPGATEAAVEVLAQLQHARTLFTRAQLDSTRAEFVKYKADAYAALTDAQLDDAGRRLAAAYIDAFYAVIESDERFYVPVVVVPNTRIFTNARQRKGACKDAVVPLGTPVSAPLETNGSMQRVLILDALWKWAPPSDCRAIYSSNGVWVATSAVSPQYPVPPDPAPPAQAQR